MSKTEPAPAADGAAPAKKKGKLKGLLVYGVGALVLLGGGVGAGLYAAGSTGGAHAEEKDVPKLVPKGEGHAEAASSEGGGHEGGGGEGGEATGGGHGAPVPEGAGTKYEATYFPLEQPFTANIRDSDGLVQLSLGVATYYDSRVIDNLKRHEMPVRSAILMELSNEDPNILATPEGKRALQQALTKTINQVLTQKEGFGGIDDVYFTSFIIQ